MSSTSSMTGDKYGHKGGTAEGDRFFLCGEYDSPATNALGRKPVETCDPVAYRGIMILREMGRSCSDLR